MGATWSKSSMVMAHFSSISGVISMVAKTDQSCHESVRAEDVAFGGGNHQIHCRLILATRKPKHVARIEALFWGCMPFILTHTM